MMITIQNETWRGPDERCGYSLLSKEIVNCGETARKEYDWLDLMNMIRETI